MPLVSISAEVFCIFHPLDCHPSRASSYVILYKENIKFVLNLSKTVSYPISKLLLFSGSNSSLLLTEVP